MHEPCGREREKLLCNNPFVFGILYFGIANGAGSGRKFGMFVENKHNESAPVAIVAAGADFQYRRRDSAGGQTVASFSAAA